jgi:hypothetical protein
MGDAPGLAYGRQRGDCRRRSGRVIGLFGLAGRFPGRHLGRPG